MNRVFLLWFLQGVTWYFYAVENQLFMLPLFGLLIFLVFVKENKRRWICVAMSFLFVLALHVQITRIPERLQETVRSRETILEGRIVSFPQIRGEYVQWVVKDLANGEKIQCTVKKEHWNEDIDYGQKIVLSGRFSLPESKRNPGGFDYRKYLYSKRIGWTFFVQTIRSEGAQDQQGTIVSKLVEMRNIAVKQLERGLKSAHIAFGKGILFGEKSMEEEEQKLFSQLGIAHILAVSGLHVGVLYGFLEGILARFSMPHPIRISILVVVLGIYAFWCGFATSVLRACGMVLLHALSIGLRKPYDSLNAMALVGCLMMVVNPFIIGTASFLLSFGAVFFISLLFGSLLHRLKRKNKSLGKITSPLLLSMCVFAGTLPITTSLFHWISPISVFLNLLVIPLASAVLLLLLSASLLLWIGLPQFGSMGIWLADKGIQGIFFMARMGKALPWSGFLAPGWASFEWFLFYMVLLGFWGYLFRTKIWRRAGLLVFIVFVFLSPSLQQVFHRELSAVFLDVGQGDSSIFHLPDGKILVVDGGGHPTKKIGKDVVLEALLSMGVRHVDVMICTHSHEDHRKGLEELMEEIPVTLLIVNELENSEAFEGLLVQAEKTSTQVLQAYRGMNLALGPQLNGTFLSPGAHETFQNANDASLVLRIQYNAISFLLTGDVETAREEILIQRGERLESQVLKIAHHGSSSSSSVEFLEEVDPDYAVISVGENNSYGHPSYKVLELLDLKGVQYYRTDQRGAVIFTTNGKTLQVQTLVKE